jgi:hypothetical protein
MAKIPITPQLNRQDFAEAPSWITKLLYPLQLFMTAVLGALTNQLTYQDNFSCVVRKFTLVAGATDTLNTYSFPWPYTRQIVELSVFVTNGDGTYTPLYPQVSWNYINGQVVINGVTGLTPTKSYNFTIVVK